MERLERLQLFGAGLIRVDTPELVRRYNACLEQIDLEPTSLESFQIDGIGWSPEIAEEKDNPRYLAHRGGNLFAIILTPDQRDKPIYVPMASYLWRLMERYFAMNIRAITDVTTQAGLCLDIDDGISKFRSPDDLLVVRRVVVRSTAGGMLKTALEQQRLVHRFLEEPMAWMDSGLRNDIAESARKHGDLRDRQLTIPEMDFDDLESFYSTAVGGVFVLRRGEAKVLILESEVCAGPPEGENVISPGATRTVCLPMAEPSTLEFLEKARFLELDFEWYRQNFWILRDWVEQLGVDALAESHPDIDFAELSYVARRRRLVELDSEMPPAIGELEMIRETLSNGQTPAVAYLTPAVRQLLLRPSQRMPKSHREALWIYLAKTRPLLLTDLYRSDKNRFFELFAEWPESKKNWAANFLRERQGTKGGVGS